LSVVLAFSSPEDLPFYILHLLCKINLVKTFYLKLVLLKFVLVQGPGDGSSFTLSPQSLLPSISAPRLKTDRNNF